MEMIKAVETEAVNFRGDLGGLQHLRRNNHMHNSKVDHLNNDDVDAILSQFINHIAGVRGVDYAHYAKDFNSK